MIIIGRHGEKPIYPNGSRRPGSLSNCYPLRYEYALHCRTPMIRSSHEHLQGIPLGSLLPLL